VQIFSHTLPVPVALSVVQLLQTTSSTPSPLSAHAKMIPVGSTSAACPVGGGDVHSNTTPGSFDPRGAGLDVVVIGADVVVDEIDDAGTVVALGAVVVEVGNVDAVVAEGLCVTAGLRAR